MNCYIIQRPTRTYKLYYANGVLRKVEVDPDFDKSFFGWIERNVMFLEVNIANYKSENIKVVLMKITFEDFWKRYDYKVKKPRAVKEWDKLKEDEKLLAYNGISKFQKNKGGYGQVALCYPDQYLKDKRWEDEH